MRSRVQRVIRSLVGVVLLLLWLPALSQAATVRVETDGGGPSDDYAIGWVAFRAAPGERNRVVAAVAGRRVVVSDQVAVRPGVGSRTSGTHAPFGV